MCLSFPQMPEKLTATEKTILEYIAGHRNDFLFLTIGQLAGILDVSEATVSRFARHVGCSDFKHLKKVVMDQTAQEGPARKVANTLAAGDGALLEHWMERQRDCLERTQELLEQESFDRAVHAVCTARRVFVYGKNASRSMAQLLTFRLRRIGIDVREMASGGTELLESLATVGAEDLVILFGFSKVSAEGRVILDCRRRAGYTTLLFTGQFYHERAQQADISLYVYRGEEGEFHSMCAAAAVIDALVLAVSSELGAAAVASLDAVRALKEMYGPQL